MRHFFKSLSRYFAILSKYEVYFFYLMVLVNLLPVFITRFFLTVDGPAHLYNSRLIVELLSGSTSLLSDFYGLNIQLLPNLSGHLILSILLTFLPAFVAEKVLILSYLILLPLTFRWLFQAMGIQQKYLLYFIFPFTYSFLFYWGFYNFIIGLTAYFGATSLWIKSLKNGFTYPRIIILFFLSLFIFFSHLFVVILLSLSIFVLNLKNIQAYFYGVSVEKERIIKSLVIQLVILIPPIILTLVYLSSSTVLDGNLHFLSMGETWSMVKQVQPAKGIEYGKEDIFTKWILISMFLISIFAVLGVITKSIKTISNQSVVWGILSALMLIMLFVLPNESANMGFLSSRFILFFFLFFIVFLATFKVPVWLQILVFIIINYANIALLKIYFKATEKNKALVEHIVTASDFIGPNSIVLPLNESDYWLLGHASNYLGVENPLIILENYEAAHDYFPVKWNIKKMPQLHAGNSLQLPMVFPENKNKHRRQIDYIFILSGNAESKIDGKEVDVDKAIEKYYEAVFISPDGKVELYKRKADF